MRLLAGNAQSSLNVKGAYLEVWSDMLGSIGVMAAAIIIWLTDWRWVDPMVAVAIGLWVLPRTWQLFSETMNILLEGVPERINVIAVKKALRAVPGVRDIHDLHVWALSSEVPSLSVHLVLGDAPDAEKVREKAAELLEERFGIDHVTLQTERTDCRARRDQHGLH
jgi:cobalt-zinc-cadmium efflux system protein